MRSFISTASVAVLVLAVAPAARADDAEDAEILKMAKEHYRLGVEAFKAGRYPEAIKELKKAYLLKRLPPMLHTATFARIPSGKGTSITYEPYDPKVGLPPPHSLKSMINASVLATKAIAAASVSPERSARTSRRKSR